MISLRLFVFALLSLLPSMALADKGRDGHGDAVHPLFGLIAPADGPFPSDRFTVADPAQNTCLRVALPKPATCAGQESECVELDLLNELDGFNLKPRLSVPFSGPIDLATVNSETIFLVKVGNMLVNGAPACPTGREDEEDGDGRERSAPGAGWVVGINQIVWDPLKNTLHVEADEVLEQHTRYALIVTRGVRDATGERIERADGFEQLRDGHEIPGAPALTAYGRELRHALAEARLAGARRDDVAVASVFTTVSGSAILEKMRDDVLSRAVPATADFNIGPGGSRAVFDLGVITKLTLNRQVTKNGPLSSTTNDVFPNTRLPLLRFVPGAISKVGFGKYRSPHYMLDDATIPVFGTFSGSPALQGPAEGTDRYFDVTIPSGPKPAGGWPVILYGHGGGDNMTASFSLAAVFASHGLATVCFNQVGHGFGPQSTFTVSRSDGPPVTFLFGGRAVDLDHNGTFTSQEGLVAIGDRAILLARDQNRQNVADIVQLLRVLEAGVDVDGDGQRDLDPSRVYFAGLSLGADLGTLVTAVEPRIRKTVLNGMSGWYRFQMTGRASLGALLKNRRPSLINPAGTPLITQRGGIAPDTRLPFGQPFFNEDMPARDTAPVMENVPGALEIQEFLERFEWLQSNHAPGAFTPYLRSKPLDGVAARPLLFQMARGDRSSAANPSIAEAIHDGQLADRVMLYHHNRPNFPDPHTFSVRIDDDRMRDVAQAAQEETAVFFASEGSTVTLPHPRFEFPATMPSATTSATAPAVIGDFGFVF